MERRFRQLAKEKGDFETIKKSIMAECHKISYIDGCAGSPSACRPELLLCGVCPPSKQQTVFMMG
jgi:hypothetical protein